MDEYIYDCYDENFKHITQIIIYMFIVFISSEDCPFYQYIIPF